MDSITQFALGAAIGEAAAGRRLGRGVALAGGIVASLPDLDVFVPLGDPVSNFTYHRSVTHSVIVLALAAPAIAWLLTRLRRAWRSEFRTCWWLCTLALVTHPLLDAFTVYGTQLLWPLTEHPFGLGSMFIIDPIYTLPLLGSVIAAQFMRRDSQRRARINRWSLGVTSAYLMASLAAQAHVSAIVAEELARQGFSAERVLVENTPFNIVAWRVVAMAPDAYRIGYYSMLAPGPVTFERFASSPEMLANLGDTWAVQRLAWFTKGFYGVVREGDTVVMRDLRMGLEPDHYVFQFAVGRFDGGSVNPMTPVRVAPAPYTDADWAELRRRVLEGG